MADADAARSAGLPHSWVGRDSAEPWLLGLTEFQGSTESRPIAAFPEAHNLSRAATTGRKTGA